MYTYIIKICTCTAVHTHIYRYSKRLKKTLRVFEADKSIVRVHESYYRYMRLHWLEMIKD